MILKCDGGTAAQRRVSIRVVLFELGKVATCLIAAELLLRLIGWTPSGQQKAANPGVIGDSVLGWRHSPGRYLFSDTLSAPRRTFAITYLSDGTRYSGETGHGAPLALFGCSFVEGYGLDDTQTFAWKVQERLSRYAVKNFGVSGYGTYSALLMMREVGAQLPVDSGAIMMYGFADFHPLRNVRNPVAQKSWGTLSDNSNGGAGYPVCNDQGCGVWPGTDMNTWWSRSRLLALGVESWEVILSLSQRGLAERVTEGLLLQMKEEAIQRGERLIIAPVTFLTAHWREFFTRNNFEVVECVSSDMSTSEYVQSDNHPNDRWTSRYAECLASYLVSHEISSQKKSSCDEDTRPR